MIEVSGIRIPLAKLGTSIESERHAVQRALVRKLGKQAGSGVWELHKRSIDARKKNDIQLVYTLCSELSPGLESEIAASVRGVRIVGRPRFVWPKTAGKRAGSGRPIVVGAGSAGLFAALALARAGLGPLLVERGDDCTRRTQAVATHNETGELDPESNIQFGLGGAGTFSDGKLATGTKATSHHAILAELVRCGADESIFFDAHPHVGSDVLPGVVEKLVSHIVEAGGEVRCRTKLVGIELDAADRVAGVILESDGREERVATDTVVIATGHSARDVFALLERTGVALERKTFAMGVRIEHSQAAIDAALYGPSAGHPLLGAAPYKLAEHLPDGRSAFSFCMCPGGYVVSAASEPGGVCTNGMSLSGRDGVNANAGLLVNVFPEDLPGESPLAGVELQRTCEQAAFAVGGGAYVAPAQLVGDFLQGVPSTAGGDVRPTYPRGVAWGEACAALPDYIGETLRAAIPYMSRKLRGFDAAGAVLTGIEARSSSPVRVTRDGRCEAIATSGLYPCGEGAGYAGGIMSAAADGIRVALSIIGE